MHLSAEQFSAILTSLHQDTPAKGADRRRNDRVERQSTLSLTLHAGHFAPLDGDAERTGEFLTLAVRNVSSRGLGLLHGQRLDAGRQFTVRFHHDHGPAVRILCTVVHCRQIAPGRFAIGAEFTCQLPVAAVA